jgi:radical SAM superfamily enzyme YgiQ (UPF0313 family)
MSVDVLIFTGGTDIGFFRPLGAYRIATELRNYGYSVQVVDMFPFLLQDSLDVYQKIIQKFVGPNTLWVGFSSTFFLNRRTILESLKEKKTRDSDSVFQFDDGGLSIPEEFIMPLREIILARNHKCKLVMGGAKASARMGRVIDIYVEGYADSSIIKMTRWLEGKNPFFQFSRNRDRFSISVIDDPKAAHFDFVNSETRWHTSDHIMPNEALPIELSRGCIFSCSFCSYPLNGKKKIDYIRDPEILIDEMTRNYELYGTTQYLYGDDTHNDSAEKLEILYNQVYSRLPFKINFYTYLRLDLLAAKPHTLQLLLDSGLRGCFFGIESLNYESAKAIGKGIKSHKVLDTLYRIKEEWKDEVITAAGFIVGLPHDTAESIREWTDVITKPDFPLNSVSIYPLSMPKISELKLWKSDLELNPEKYGYHYPDDNRPRYWANETTGMTFELANEIANEAVMKASVNSKKLGPLQIPGLLNLGFTFEQVKQYQSDQNVLIGSHALRSKINSTYIKNILH